MIKLSRRDFLKLGLTAGLVAGSLSFIDWDRAIAKAIRLMRRDGIHIVWIESQDCAGDSIALLDATNPELLEILLGSFKFVGPGTVFLTWHQTLMPQWGVTINGKPQMFTDFAIPVVIIDELLKFLKEIGSEKLRTLKVEDVVKAVEEFATKLETEGVYIKTVGTLKIPAEYTKSFIMEIVEDIVRLHRVKLEDIPKALAYITETLGPLTDILDGYALSWPFESVEVLKLVEEGKIGPFVLVIEGAIPAGEILDGVEGWYSMVGEEHGRPITCTEWIIRLAGHPNCLGVVCAGTCASFGGFPSNKVFEVEQIAPKHLELFMKYLNSPTPTGSVGFFPDPVKGRKGLLGFMEDIRRGRISINIVKKEVRDYVEEALEKFGTYYEFYRSRGTKGTPCYAVAGCPASGDAILRTLALVVLAVVLKEPRLIPKTDEYGRPLYLFARSVHEQCPRAGAYAGGQFRPYPGASEPEHGWKCLFSVGCKGPVVHCPYGGGKPLGWIRGLAGCIRQGAICIGCTMPGFSDAFEPFFKPLPAPTPPGIAETAGIGIASFAVGAGIAAALTRYVKRRAERVGGSSSSSESK